MTESRFTRLEALNDLLFYRLSRVHGTAGSLVVRLCEGAYGITRREWRVLGQLVEHPHMAPSELARQANQDKARTSRAITSLVGKGLVVRQAQVGDRRYATVSLSPAGRALYDTLMPQVRALNWELLGALAPDEVAVLDGMLDRLQAQADRMVKQHQSGWPKSQRRMGGRGGVAPRDLTRP
jgi:DNA-binding MarR family transcriptional regulator